jgi:hypothetical protein
LWIVLLIASCYGPDQCGSTEHLHDGGCGLCVVDAGSGSNPDVGFCNVLTQTGCYTGEQCTWLIDEIDPTTLEPIGHIGCAPAGNKATDAPCTRNPPGARGYDDCGRGDYCFGPPAGGSGTCKQICDQAQGYPNCGPTGSCVTYQGVFGPYGMAVAAGLCEHNCDPLADNTFLGPNGNSRTGTACGSATVWVNGNPLDVYGCYGLPYPPNGATRWTCSEQKNFSRVHRTACDSTQHPGDLGTCQDTNRTGYVNGCASGYEPLYLDFEGATSATCVALCAPANCYNMGSGSSSGNSSCGSGSAVNVTGSAPYQCVARRLQTAAFNEVDPAGSNNGEQCLYSWLLEIDSTSGLFTGASLTSNTVGFCVDHSLLKYDPTGGSNATTEWPRCDQIGLGSGGYNVSAYDAASFGCVDTTTARAFGDANVRRPELRLSRSGRR